MDELRDKANPYEAPRLTPTALNPRRLLGLKKLVQLLAYGYVALIVGFSLVLAANELSR